MQISYEKIKGGKKLDRSAFRRSWTRVSVASLFFDAAQRSVHLLIQK